MDPKKLNTFKISSKDQLKNGDLILFRIIQTHFLNSNDRIFHKSSYITCLLPTIQKIQVILLLMLGKNIKSYLGLLMFDRVLTRFSQKWRHY